MATPEIIRNAGIWVAQYDLQGSMNSVALSVSFESQECTPFGAGARQYAIGLPRAPLSAAGYPKDDAADAAVFGLTGLQNLPVTICKAKSIGAVAFVGSFLDGSYQSVFDVSRVRQFQLNGEVSERSLGRGRIMHLGVGVTATGAGAGQELRAISATKKAFATLHLTSKAGTTPAFTGKIESDDNSDFSSPVTRATFSALSNTVGAQLVAIDGAITDTFWRAAWTITGTTPVFDFCMALGFEEPV